MLGYPLQNPLVRILTDIQGIEDFLGDMDFKVAGTDTGITALQMDMKITGLPLKVIADAINQAKPARLHILEKMLAAIDKPRTELSPYAPRLISFKIDPEMIGMVIGPGGKKIKAITEQTGAKVDINDDGTVTVSAIEGEKALQAKALIESIVFKPSAGDVFAGKVTRVIPILCGVYAGSGRHGSHLSAGRLSGRQGRRRG
jgi:polyribonucleotide nucleotidyltransferase